MTLEKFSRLRESIGLTDEDGIAFRSANIGVSFGGVLDVLISWDGKVTLNTKGVVLGVEHLEHFARALRFIKALNLPEPAAK
jgi:hypothetical protein